MFNFFKKKKVEEQQVSTKETTLDPVYDELVSKDYLSKLKISMVDALSEISPIQQLSKVDKQLAIESILFALPERVKNARQKEEKFFYIFGSSIGSMTCSQMNELYGGSDKVFEQIANDLCLVLQTIGLKPELTSSKNGIKLNTESL